MRMREYFEWQAGEFDFLWKSQMFLGVLLILTGIAVALFPAILVALVAAGITIAGAGLVSSAWRLRRLQQRTRGFEQVSTFEW